MTRNRLRGEKDLVPPEVARRAAASSRALRTGAALHADEQLQREFTETVTFLEKSSNKVRRFRVVQTTAALF